MSWVHNEERAENIGSFIVQRGIVWSKYFVLVPAHVPYSALLGRRLEVSCEAQHQVIIPTCVLPVIGFWTKREAILIRILLEMSDISVLFRPSETL